MPRKSDDDGRRGGERGSGRDGVRKAPFRSGGPKSRSGGPKSRSEGPDTGAAGPSKPRFGKTSAGKANFSKAGSDRPGRASSGKPRFDDRRSDTPRSDRSYAGKPRSDRPFGAKPRSEKSRDGADRKSLGRPRPEGASVRPRFDKPRTGAPRTDGPRGDSSRSDRKRSDHSRSDRPRFDNARDEKPRFEKPRFDKPRFDKPGFEKPRFDKSRGRPAAAVSGERPERAQAQPHKEADRIARVIARAGLCSRREAEDWIVAGRVAVNGAVISSPALDVTARDKITVDGAPLPQRERTRLFLFHKPAGVVTTNLDPEGRPTIFDRLPSDLPRLLTVGRLDIGTEGLLLLTNDGGLSRVLELPETGWLRRYRVRANGQVTQPALDALRGGVTVDGIDYGPIEATLDREQGANVWITFAIREGKNREVRNVMSHLGLLVNRLIRVSFGPFQLGELAEGAIEEVRTRVLRDQLGERVTAEAGCDFGAPIRDEAVEPAPRTRRETPPLQDIRPALSAWAEHPRSDAPRPERDSAPRGDSRTPRRDGKREARNFDRFAREPDRPTPENRSGEPMGRPRRGHAWRSEDSPLRTKYRGGEREPMRKPLPQDVRAGLVKDRRGRDVTVERFGERPEKKEIKRAPRRFSNRDGKPPRLDTQDPRSERKEPRDKRSQERRGEYQGPRSERQGPRSERNSRGDAPRSFSDRKAEPRGERKDGPRGERKDGLRGERKFGKPGGRPPRSFGGPPERGGGGKRIGRGDRSSGPRSSRPE